MPAGRPRTVSLPANEMVKLGREMVEWVKKNKPLHLSGWYCIEKGYTYKQWDTFMRRSEFIKYYEQGLKIVGMQYLDKTSNVRDLISQRWLRVYFKDLKHDEDELLKLKADLARKQKEEEIKDDGAKLAKAIKECCEMNGT